jgi:hypothetical protein
LPRNVDCTDGGLPGSTEFWRRTWPEFASPRAASSAAGPTGRDVTLGLLVEFLGKAEGHHKVEVPRVTTSDASTASSSLPRSTW